MATSFRARVLDQLQPIALLRMTRECNARGGINLAQGLAELPLRDELRTRTREAILGPEHTYSYPEGIGALRKAISAKLARDNQITADPDSEVIVTIGSTGAFDIALTALLNPGDGVLLLEPYYVGHLFNLVIRGMRPRFLQLAAPAFELTEAALRAAIEPGVRAIVINTPCNPSGRVLTRAELAILARVAVEHDLLVLSDEVYEYIRFDGRPHVSPATLESLRHRTVVLNSLSKTYSMTGWRLGYAVAPPPLAAAMKLVNSVSVACAATPLQHGAIAGFELPPEYYAELASTYQRKRDLLCSAIEGAGMVPIVPEGAFYVLADISRLGYASALEAALDLLDRSGVAAVPGTDFYSGQTGEQFLRFCFGVDSEKLERASAALRGTKLTGNRRH